MCRKNTNPTAPWEFGESSESKVPDTNTEFDLTQKYLF